MSSFSTANEVKAAAETPASVFLDVRTDEEIQEARLVSRPFVHVSCSPSGDCSELVATANKILPDKHAPVIIYCGSGRRANFAKNALEELGYTNVLNAGGFNDLTKKLA